MKTSSYIVIAGVALLALGIGVFIVSTKQTPLNLENKKDTGLGQQEKNILILDKKDVFFSEEKRGAISLYSLDAKEEIVQPDEASCMTPVAGKRKYSGNFILEFQGKTLPIGEMVFVEGTAHSGTLNKEKLVPGNHQDFILLKQYGNCNDSIMRIYGYDVKSDQFVQYEFKQKDGKKEPGIYGEISSDFNPASAENRADEFPTTAYDQEIGKYRVTTWRFNAQENIFEEIASRAIEVLGK